MSQAVITDVHVAAAHDGVAEMVVILRHDNGGTSRVSLDEVAADALMRRCGASTTEELRGTGWEAVREALAVSWNRYIDK